VPDKTIVYVCTRSPDGNVCDEPLVAVRIGPGLAKLTSIPMIEVSLSLGDLVRLDDEDFVVGVAERSGARTRRGCFEQGPDLETARQRLRTIRAGLAEHDVAVAPDPDSPTLWPPGVLLLSVPAEISDDELLAINGRSTVPWVLVVEEGMAEPAVRRLVG
jgi:hypothetical protein